MSRVSQYLLWHVSETAHQHPFSHFDCLQEGREADREPLTKAIVFSQLWTHAQLIEGQLRGHGVGVAVLKGNMKPEEKAASLRSFRRRAGSARAAALGLG